MNNPPSTTLPDWQRERLTLLLDALDGVPPHSRGHTGTEARCDARR